MKKLTYIQPAVLQVPLDMEQMIANTPMTSGLQNGDGSNGDYGLGNNDDGTDPGDENGNIWGDTKGDNGLWSDMW